MLTGPSFFTRLWSNPASRTLIALVLVLALGCVFNADGAFFKPGTHRDALRQAAVFGMLACGVTLVIIGGGIDLAVGSVLALVAVSFSLMSIHWGWSPWLAVPACLVFGALCGGAAGGITAGFRVQPLDSPRCAMMVFTRGLAKTISGGMKVSTAVKNTAGGYDYVPVPGVFRLIDNRILGDNVAVVTVIFVAGALLTWLMLARHRWGRELYAIGGNEEAARLSGVPVLRTKIIAYAASGLLAAVAGMCQAAQEQLKGIRRPGLVTNSPAIAIVVIGGTPLTGGRGGIGLTLLGTLDRLPGENPEHQRGSRGEPADVDRGDHRGRRADPAPPAILTGPGGVRAGRGREANPSPRRPMPPASPGCHRQPLTPGLSPPRMRGGCPKDG